MRSVRHGPSRSSASKIKSEYRRRERMHTVQACLVASMDDPVRRSAFRLSGVRVRTLAAANCSIRAGHHSSDRPAVRRWLTCGIYRQPLAFTRLNCKFPRGGGAAHCDYQVPDCSENVGDGPLHPSRLSATHRDSDRHFRLLIPVERTAHGLFRAHRRDPLEQVRRWIAWLSAVSARIKCCRSLGTRGGTTGASVLLGYCTPRENLPLPIRRRRETPTGHDGCSTRAAVLKTPTGIAHLVDG